MWFENCIASFIQLNEMCARKYCVVGSKQSMDENSSIVMNWDSYRRKATVEIDSHHLIFHVLVKDFTSFHCIDYQKLNECILKDRIINGGIEITSEYLWY